MYMSKMEYYTLFNNTVKKISSSRKFYILYFMLKRADYKMILNLYIKKILDFLSGNHFLYQYTYYDLFLSLYAELKIFFIWKCIEKYYEKIKLKC